MGFLLLSGGGNAEQTRPLNRFFADQAKGHLLYIPIAGDPKVRSYNHSFEYIKSVFYPLGITNMTMWTDLAGKTNLTPYSAIYFSGGNTLRLLNHIRSTQFERVLKQFYDEGGVIYGQSAGAIIFGQHIIDSNSKGLGFFGINSIECHYKNEQDPLLLDFVNTNHSPVVAIPEGTAVYYQNKKIKVLGEKDVYLFEENSKIRFTSEM